MTNATIHDFTPGNVHRILRRGAWALISAEVEGNPVWSSSLRARVNAARTSHLRRNLARFNVDEYEVIGYWAGARECSSLVLGISPVDALLLGRMYGQQAVITRDGLIYCDTGVIRPALEVIEVPRAKLGREDHTYVPATEAAFRIVFPEQHRLEHTA